MFICTSKSSVLPSCFPSKYAPLIFSVSKPRFNMFTLTLACLRALSRLDTTLTLPSKVSFIFNESIVNFASTPGDLVTPVNNTSPLSVPLLGSENTFSVLQRIQTTGSELLRLTRGGGSIDGEGQEIRLLGGVSGASGSGFLFAHYSLTSSVSTVKNYLRFYDEGLSVDNAAAAKVLDVNTSTGTIAVTWTT